MNGSRVLSAIRVEQKYVQTTNKTLVGQQLADGAGKKLASMKSAVVATNHVAVAPSLTFEPLSMSRCSSSYEPFFHVLLLPEQPFQRERVVGQRRCKALYAKCPHVYITESLTRLVKQSTSRGKLSVM